MGKCIMARGEIGGQRGGCEGGGGAWVLGGMGTCAAIIAGSHLSRV